MSRKEKTLFSTNTLAYFNKSLSNNICFNIGIWTNEEKILLIKGIKLHKRNLTKISLFVKTRSVIQLRTFIQKFVIKLSNRYHISRENFSEKKMIGDTLGISTDNLLVLTLFNNYIPKIFKMKIPKTRGRKKKYIERYNDLSLSTYSFEILSNNIKVKND